MNKMTLDQIMWHEYDNAARDLARRGLKGDIGDPLPFNMCKATCDLIDADPEAFQKRVRAFAYGEAMDRLNLPEDDGMYSVGGLIGDIEELERKRRP